jgi:uncharacterized protein (DUF58 family)
MSIANQLQGNVKARFNKWVNRRLLPKRKQTLNNKNLFIFPSKAGLGFLFVDFLLWLLGTNYENNMILGLAFFLMALFLVSIYHTFFNMAGLQLEFLRSTPCFVGEQGEVEILVSCQGEEGKESIAISYDSGSSVIVNLINDNESKIKLFVEAKHRGWFKPERIDILSRFPLGIIRCWSRPDLDVQILVYPKPVEGSEMPVSRGSENEGELLDASGAEDFYGFKPHLTGMSPKHIAWKQYARGQGLYSKDYVAYREQKVWLDWDALQGMAREQRLSRLCYWVLKISSTQQAYGLRLPNVEIEPNIGAEHKLQVLKALALFEWNQ